MRYLLDTNICIYALKNRPPEVLERLHAVGPNAVAISVITAMELRQGAELSERSAANHARIDTFTELIRVLPFDLLAAAETAKVRAYLRRRGTPIGDLDSLIAGHAIAGRLVLVSNNLREFDRVPGLMTENWVEPGTT